MYFVSTLMTNIVKLGWNWITYVQAQNPSSLSHKKWRNNQTIEERNIRLITYPVLDHTHE